MNDMQSETITTSSWHNNGKHGEFLAPLRSTSRFVTGRRRAVGAARIPGAGKRRRAERFDLALAAKMMTDAHALHHSGRANESS